MVGTPSLFELRRTSRFAHPTPSVPRSIQREARRKSAEVRRRVERLTVDRAIVVFAREVRVPVRRRKGIVQELAIAGQYFGAAVEPGALADVDARMRSLLIGDVGAAGPVIGTAVIIMALGGLGAGRADVAENR